MPRELIDDFVPYALLLASGEAWLEGMLITLLVVYLPGSVRLFDEGFYLGAGRGRRGGRRRPGTRAQRRPVRNEAPPPA